MNQGKQSRNQGQVRKILGKMTSLIRQTPCIKPKIAMAKSMTKALPNPVVFQRNCRVLIEGCKIIRESQEKWVGLH